jgi:protein O-GlcNAc transferase
MLNRLFKTILRATRSTASVDLDDVMRLGAQGRLQEAEIALASLGAQHSDDPRAHLAAGLLAYRRSDYVHAIACLEAARRLAPDDASIAVNYGEALRAVGRLSQAEAVLREALARDPAQSTGWLNLAQLLLQRGRRSAACDAARQALRLVPDDPRAHLVLGCGLLSRSEAEDALVHLRRASALAPDLLAARFYGARAAALACDWSWPSGDAAALVELWARNPEHPQVAEFQPFLAYELPVTNALRRLVAEHYAKRIRARATALPPVFRPRAAGERLRVGYLSADFHNHPTMHLAAGLFELHDHSRFELFVYSFGDDDGSEYRRRVVAAADHFVDVSADAPQQIAHRIRADGVQILVDMKGFTLLARPEILALRPAPVQVAFLGYPGTMGSGLADYIVTDRVVTPPGSEAFFGEAFALLPGSYQVNDRDQAIAAERPTRSSLGLPEVGLVLCCFNMPYKIEPGVFDAWMRILAAVPDAVLWVLAKPEFAATNLRREAEVRGIDSARLVFARFAPKPQHLARLACADLFLDTRYVNAHTGASDALWAGVPVVTCAGDSFPARVAASLLDACGLGELAVDSLERYEELVISLARDRKRLAGLRARLAHERLSCALFDTARYTRNLERAFDAMWQVHEQGGGARAFSVLETSAPREVSRRIW